MHWNLTVKTRDNRTLDWGTFDKKKYAKIAAKRISGLVHSPKIKKTKYRPVAILQDNTTHYITNNETMGEFWAKWIKTPAVIL